MSLGRPDAGSVKDEGRLLQILTGLYDELGHQRNSITLLQEIKIKATSTSTAISINNSKQSSPLSESFTDGEFTDGPQFVPVPMQPRPGSVYAGMPPGIIDTSEDDTGDSSILPPTSNLAPARFSLVWWINRTTFSSASSSAYVSTYSTDTQSLPYQWPTRFAYSRAAVYLNISTNTGTGAGSWKVTLYKGGVATSATSGNISLGTTGLIDSGVQAVSIAPGDVLGMVLDGSSLTGTITIELSVTLDLLPS